MSVVRCKPGVLFTVIAPAGFHILSALDTVAEKCSHDLMITSACDGVHSGPDDPHHLGAAYDIRISDLPDPSMVLQDIQLELGTSQFYAFIEDPGTPNEHIHCQLRHGVSYP